MPVESLKPCSAGDGQSVVHIVPGECHTVPSPEHSQQNGAGKGKRTGGVHMDVAGRPPPAEIWVSWDGRRPGARCFANHRCLAAEVFVAVVSWPPTLVQGHPTRQTEFCPSPKSELPCWAMLPAPRKSVARAVLELPGRSWKAAKPQLGWGERACVGLC